MIRMMTDHDYDEVLSWMRARGINHINRQRLSDVGLIDDNLSAGFIYKSPGSSTCYVDNLCTNPGSTPLAAGASLMRLARSIVGQCFEMGGDYVIAFSEHPEIANMCYKRLMASLVTGHIMCTERRNHG